LLAGTVEFTFQLARSYYQHGDWNQMTMDERDEYVDPPVINVDAPGLERFSTPGPCVSS